MNLSIITDNRARPLLDWGDLSETERKEFDWIENPEGPGESFFRYRGGVYAVSDFMRCDRIPKLSAWHGYYSDSYFSGILIRFPGGNPDSILVGRYCA